MKALAVLMLVTATASARPATVLAIHGAGGEIVVDGEARGNVPADVQVLPGKHLVQVDRFGAWVTVRRGDTHVVDVVQPEPFAPTGLANELSLRRAEQAFRNGDFTGCYEIYYRFAQAQQLDRDVGLYDAGVCARFADRPRTALAMFDALTTDRTMWSSSYWLEALRQEAATEQAMLDYDASLETWLALRQFAMKARKIKLRVPPPMMGERPATFDEIAATALWNAGMVAEMAGDDAQAAELLADLLAGPTTPHDEDRALWELARIQRRLGRDASATLLAWRLRYGASEPENYVESFAGDDAALVAAWKLVGGEQKSRAARLAGYATLQIVEADYEKNWVPYGILLPAANIDQARTQNADLVKLRDSFESRYKNLDAFGIAELSLAAVVRFGDLENGFAQKVMNAAIPTPVANACTQSNAGCAKYTQGLSQGVAKTVAAAEAAWNDAVKAKVSSPWTTLAAEKLHALDPTKYPEPPHEPIAADLP